jgi:nicotinate-nucleotide pyrophosphorylase (carboxylating)
VVPGVSDIRYEIFRDCMSVSVTGALVSEGAGILSGLGRARKRMTDLGLVFSTSFSEGSRVEEEERIATVTGNPVQIAMAEEQIIGILSKSSGIATAARLGPGKEVVSGGWKKMPSEIKEIVRQAALDGGIHVRICREPFVYLDKNYVRMLGGVRASIQRTLPLAGTVVIQIRGETKAIGEEAVEAAESGAKIVMVDTGSHEDLEQTTRALTARGLRSRVRVAFSGEITLERIGGLSMLDMDIIDVGYAILDAPCLSMRFDVLVSP